MSNFLDICLLFHYAINKSLIFLIRGVAFTAKSSLRSIWLSALLATLNVVSKTLPKMVEVFYVLRAYTKLGVGPFIWKKEVEYVGKKQLCSNKNDDKKWRISND
ncbi:hypothetical protein CEW92_05450 [Bacillaceae bacterium SAS-127]|nr:hypothetical protein CEW92_05450 [Bacillaceae bacterium SAS-127]